MTTSALLQQGLQLMVLGMGSVFVFLVLLIVSMLLTARLVRAIESRHQPEVVSDAASSPSTATNSEVVAAISAALQRYRKTHRQGPS